MITPEKEFFEQYPWVGSVLELLPPLFRKYFQQLVLYDLEPGSADDSGTDDEQILKVISGKNLSLRGTRLFGLTYQGEIKPFLTRRGKTGEYLDRKEYSCFVYCAARRGKNKKLFIYLFC